MHNQKIRYRCKYCGTDDICDIIPSWLLKDKRCKVCNHGKFVEKKIAHRDVDYYNDKEPEYDWGDE